MKCVNFRLCKSICNVSLCRFGFLLIRSKSMFISNFTLLVSMHRFFAFHQIVQIYLLTKDFISLFCYKYTIFLAFLVFSNFDDRTIQFNSFSHIINQGFHIGIRRLNPFLLSTFIVIIDSKSLLNIKFLVFTFQYSIGKNLDSLSIFTLDDTFSVSQALYILQLYSVTAYCVFMRAL